MYDKTHSEETKRKISEKQKIIHQLQGNLSQKSEVREKISNTLKGHSVSKSTREKLKQWCWVHKDKERKFIHKDELNSYLQNGYSPCRGGK